MSIELPTIEPRTLNLSYTFPHVVVSVSETNGQRQYTVLEGGQRPVTLEVEEYYRLTEEFAQPFKVIAYNQFSIAGVTFAALNDAAPEMHILPSNPTASEYMAQRGTRVLRSFSCTLDKPMTEKNGAPVYRVYKAWMRL